jgi:elongation factor Ts
LKKALTSLLKKILSSDFNGMTVAEKLIEQTGVIGEKIKSVVLNFRRCFCWILCSRKQNCCINCYFCCCTNAEVLTKDISMQVASMGADTLSYKDFDLLLLILN